jgi:hypothetical protein
MKIKQKIIAVLLVCGGQACIGQVVAPEVVASAGDMYSNPQGSLSWTMGEPITTTENASNYFLTQGFQQPTKIVVAAVSGPSNSQSNSVVNVYPNPVTSSSINIQWGDSRQLQIQLLDLSGRVILNKVISSSENQLDLNELSNGMYLLKVYDMQNELIKSLKIEKIK